MVEESGKRKAGNNNMADDDAGRKSGKRKAGTMDDADAGQQSKQKDKQLSKRQRRKQPNDKQKWPQHPKIQSMEARHKAYIRVAGVNAKVKENVDPKLDLMSPEVKFGRLLGGTDQRKRHAAVNKLKAYLKARSDIENENGGLSEMDLLKLWKGLWFTLYMADKVPVQDELSKTLAQLLWCVAGTEEEDEYAGQAYLEMCKEEEGQEEEEDSDDEDDDDFNEEDVTMEEIVNTLRAEGYDADSAEEEEDSDDEEDDEEGDDSDEEDDDEHVHDENCNHDHDHEGVDESEIPHCRGAHLASLFVRTFFRTIRREWGNMDKYRVDKFYTLTRMYLHEIFKYMATRHWNLGIITLFNDAMFEEVLNQTPNGLRYHFIDVALEELAKVNAKAPLPLTEATFLEVLEPYLAMCQTGAGDHVVQDRTLERVLGKFLDTYSVVSDKALEEENEDEKKEESLILDQVHVGTIAQFIFELASDPETKDQYRKSLYEMHKKYMRRLKTAGKDVDKEDGTDGALEYGVEGEEENDEDVDVEDEMDEESKEEKESLEIVAKDDSEKKKSKNKRKLNETVKVSSEDVEPTDTAKGKKKKKKKKKKGAVKEDSEEAPAADEKAPVADDLGDRDTEPKKKNKKKKGASKEATATPDAKDEEEVITISLSEQKRAKKEEKKKKKQKSVAGKAKKEEKEKPPSSVPDSADRRVKFGKVNRSKSYKASMKALFTGDVPKTAVSTPEKGILLNKGKTRRAAVTKKSGRKKAINYF